MRVFHFLNKKYGFKDIRERRIKVATIMELNAVLEFLSFNLSNHNLRLAMSKTSCDTIIMGNLVLKLTNERSRGVYICM